MNRRIFARLALIGLVLGLVFSVSTSFRFRGPIGEAISSLFPPSALGASGRGIGGIAGCADVQEPLVEVTPSQSTVVLGERLQLKVTRRFPGETTARDVTRGVLYLSSDGDIASVDANGLLLAKTKAGAVTIRAVDQSSGVIGTAEFSVVAARIESIEIDPSPAVVLTPGASSRFKAKARFSNGTERDVTNEVQWRTSNEAVATVGQTANDLGLVTAVSTGDATVVATDAVTLVQGRTLVFVRGAAAELRALVVAPNPAAVAVGGTAQLTATGLFADGTSKDLSSAVTWSSSRPTILTVSTSGLAAGVAAGDATVTAEVLAGNAVAVRASAAAKVQ